MKKIRQSLLICILGFTLGCGEGDFNTVDTVRDREYRASYYSDCRAAGRSSLRWKAMAQCVRTGLGDSIGGGCEHWNPRIPTESDYHPGKALIINTMEDIEKQIKAALNYCEVFNENGGS